ncbi:MAG: glycosyltransferase 87 family protein, partial [Acidobacteriales bacterium]|nr:glycosyltransferase 87 family protein [Terriglobales bacterium]
LAYIPFYLMVRAGWHSLLIGSTLALLHSTCLWLVYGISRTLIPAGTPHRTLMIAASVSLAFLAPVYLIEVGSTFIDVTTTIPVLAGIWLLMIYLQRGEGALMAVAAGLLMGSAAGLKLTNAIFPVAAAAFIVLASRPIKVRIYDLMRYVAGGLGGFLLVEGAWAYKLFKTFGNPFFPFFNAWFPSPDFPRFNIRHYRFLPDTASDYFAFAFRMLDHNEHVYAETMSPDVRFLALFAILAAIGTAALICRLRGRNRPTAVRVREAANHRLYVAALAFTLLSYGLWLASSGNGRYALALGLIVGPMIPASILVISRSKRLLVYVTGALLLIQATIVKTAVELRWAPAEWKSTWYDLNVPAMLQKRRFLFLSLDHQPAAFLAPFMNPGSAFSNLVGQTSLALDRPGGARLRALLDRYRPNIRTLLLLKNQTDKGEPHASMFTYQNTVLESVGLQVDEHDCMAIEMHDFIGDMRHVLSLTSKSVFAYRADTTTFLTCATEPLESSAVNQRLAERRARADRAFAMLEAMCPRVFSPAGAYTEHVNEQLGRSYVNSDVRLWEANDIVRYKPFTPGDPILVGKVDEILQGKIRPECRSTGALPFGIGN